MLDGRGEIALRPSGESEGALPEDAGHRGSVGLGQRGFGEDDRAVVVAREHRGDGQDRNRFRSPRRALVGPAHEHLAADREHLRRTPAVHHREQRQHQPEHPIRSVVVVDAPVDGGEQVGGLRRDAGDDLARPLAQSLDHDAICERDHRIGEARAHRVGVGERVNRVLADQVEHRVGRRNRIGTRDEQRPLHEPCEQVERRELIRLRDCGGEVGVERAREHAELLEELPLLGREERDRRVDRVAHARVTSSSAVGGRVQQVQAPLDVGEEIEWGYRTGAGGGEFERERHPVERAAQCDDRVIVSIECGTRRGGAVREELHRVTVVERFDNHHLLACDSQRLAARRDDAHVVARLQQRRYEAGDGVEHVFTVVEHDDRRAFGQRAPPRRRRTRSPSRLRSRSRPRRAGAGCTRQRRRRRRNGGSPPRRAGSCQLHRVR